MIFLFVGFIFDICWDFVGFVILGLFGQWFGVPVFHGWVLLIYGY